jgi:hypothetical protein
VEDESLSEFQSGHSTARKAERILVDKDFTVPTGKQRQNLLVAFAKKGKSYAGERSTWSSWLAL